MSINKCNKNLIEYGEVGERVAGVDLGALRLSAISPHPSSPSRLLLFLSPNHLLLLLLLGQSLFQVDEELEEVVAKTEIKNVKRMERSSWKHRISKHCSLGRCTLKQKTQTQVTISIGKMHAP